MIRPMTPARGLIAVIAAGLVGVVAFPLAASAAPDVDASSTRPNWRAVPLTSPEPDADNQSFDVECDGATCHVLGLIGSEDNGLPYLTTLSGHTPSSQLITGVHGTTGRALSCPTADWCMAVGSVHTNAPSDRTWAASYSRGRWTTHATPTPTNGLKGQGYLFDVSCTSSSWCAAVGWYFDREGRAQGLLLEWNGRSWKRVEEAATPNRFIRTIDCLSARHCVLVGLGAGKAPRVQMRQWTPRGWYRISGAPVGASGFEADLDCQTLDSCVITASKGADSPLLLRTEGRTAHEIALPASPLRPTDLRSVSCDPTGTCFAVGGAPRADDMSTPAVVQVSRRDRVALSTPYRSVPYGSILMAVDCDTRCVAVGQGMTADFVLSPVALIQRPTPGR